MEVVRLSNCVEVSAAWLPWFGANYIPEGLKSMGSKPQYFTKAPLVFWVCI